MNSFELNYPHFYVLSCTYVLKINNGTVNNDTKINLFVQHTFRLILSQKYVLFCFFIFYASRHHPLEQRLDFSDWTNRSLHISLTTVSGPKLGMWLKLSKGSFLWVFLSEINGKEPWNFWPASCPLDEEGSFEVEDNKAKYRHKLDINGKERNGIILVLSLLPELKIPGSDLISILFP